jgi:hypothetical protein
MVNPTSIQWQGISLVVAGFIIAVVLARLIQVLVDIRQAKKMQKQENLQPLLGVVSPNFDKIVEMAKEEKDVTKRKRK